MTIDDIGGLARDKLTTRKLAPSTLPRADYRHQRRCASSRPYYGAIDRRTAE
ncbi:MAG: hypothetical protein ACRDOA_17910 [Streptosporangiaceae bacterium]